MGRGARRKGPGATFADLAADFLVQWRSREGREPSERVTVPDDGKVPRLRQCTDQVLRSWKRDGGEVTVRRGRSTGFRKRQAERRQAVNAAREEPASVLPVASKPVALDHASAKSVKPPKSSLRERLAAVSAEVHALKISSAQCTPRELLDLPPIIEEGKGAPAILGLDFGTAFTKAVVRWAGRHHAVDWAEIVAGDDPCLMAAVFSECDQGRCVLGRNAAPGWRVHEGIKLRLLGGPSGEDDESAINAAIYIALAFRYVDQWLRRNHDAEGGVQWRLHLGLPARSWDDSPATEVFNRAAKVGAALAYLPGPVTRAAAQKALHDAHIQAGTRVAVLPEFACQLYSYLGSPERRNDLHALVDIGAGTLDVSFFNVATHQGETRLVVFASEVEHLGAHYLIAALAGRGARNEWDDGDSSLSDMDVAVKAVCPVADVSDRRSLFMRSVARRFNRATNEARRMYSTSPAFRGEEPLRVFMCGGGARIRSFQRRFEKIKRDARGPFNIDYQLSELVRPRDMVGQFQAGFDRLSVAYGLSQIPYNLGVLVRSVTLEPVVRVERQMVKDRDDDR